MIEISWARRTIITLMVAWCINYYSFGVSECLQYLGSYQT